MTPPSIPPPSSSPSPSETTLAVSEAPARASIAFTDASADALSDSSSLDPTPSAPPLPLQSPFSSPRSSPRSSLQLPPDSFYWARLNISRLPKQSRLSKRRRNEQLGYLFEAVLPVPIEHVHAVYVPQGNSTVIACGMETSRLESRLADETGDLLSLGPTSTPDFLASGEGASIAPEAINMLQERYEPTSIRRLRARVIQTIAAGFILCALLLAAGFEIRSARFDQQAAQLIQDRQALCQAVLSETGASHGNTSPDLAMLSELRRLRQTRQQPMDEVRLHDCTQELAHLLAEWPSSDNVHMQTDSISVTPSAITVRGIVPTSLEAQRLVAKLGDRGASEVQLRGGWVMRQPQIQTTRDAVQTTLTWQKENHP